MEVLLEYGWRCFVRLWRRCYGRYWWPLLTVLLAGHTWLVGFGCLVLALLATAILLGVVAGLQLAVGIFRYGSYYEDAPWPLTPTHGVVIVESKRTPKKTRATCTSEDLGGLSLGCQCGLSTQRPVDPLEKTERGIAGFEEDARAPGRRPIRLLVIGDSAALGVGQTRCCGPLLPEVMAKTISQQLRGRTVYWTCHGSVGATMVRLARELEQGIEQVEDERNMPAAMLNKSQSMCCSAEASNSKADNTATSSPETVSAMMKEQENLWRERLSEHGKRFDHKAMGPYDVVVVLTGLNDIKSQYIPILLGEDDAKFRKDVMGQGANHEQEVRMLLQTLNRCMRSSQSRSISDDLNVEESIANGIDVTEESTTSPRSKHLSPKRSQDFGDSFCQKTEATKEEYVKIGVDESECNVDDDDDDDGAFPKDFPLVVFLSLRGLCNTLPLFRQLPLQWVAGTCVDCQDMHKRNVAKQHPDKVLLVPPPKLEDIVKYENWTGKYWRQRCEENTLLSLRDTPQRHCEMKTSQMRDYYAVKDPRILTGHGFQKTPDNSGKYSCFHARSATPGTSIFSLDGIHPMDEGYDFLGRFIAEYILDQWRANPHLEPSL